MNETSKCYQMRKARGDFDSYLKGNGIDIGCGPDVLRVENGTVRGWDQANGDAQALNGIPNGTYDFAYSSHCLEHMRSVPHALSNWRRIIKPGGCLYVVVPDYTYYEKMRWPSLFNSDHKHTFSQTLKRSQVRRDDHWNIAEDLTPLLASLGIPLRRVTLELDGFDFNHGPADQTMGAALSQICLVSVVC